MKIYSSPLHDAQFTHAQEVDLLIKFLFRQLKPLYAAGTLSEGKKNTVYLLSLFQ